MIHLLLGGPVQKIRAGHHVFEFEMHRYCGPVALNRFTGEPLKRQTDEFLIAASQWAQQGQKVEGGFCVYDSSIPLL